MNTHSIKFVWIISTFAAIALFAVGCNKTEPADSGRLPSADATNTTQAVEAKTAEAVEQTRCPVMDAPINKDLFVEYKGKKVYFCCAGCEKEFEKNPEKYLSKLPQFKEE